MLCAEAFLVWWCACLAFNFLPSSASVVLILMFTNSLMKCHNFHVFCSKSLTISMLLEIRVSGITLTMLAVRSEVSSIHLNVSHNYYLISRSRSLVHASLARGQSTRYRDIQKAAWRRSTAEGTSVAYDVTGFYLPPVDGFLIPLPTLPMSRI